MHFPNNGYGIIKNVTKSPLYECINVQYADSDLIVGQKLFTKNNNDKRQGMTLTNPANGGPLLKEQASFFIRFPNNEIATAHKLHIDTLIGKGQLSL